MIMFYKHESDKKSCQLAALFLHTDCCYTVVQGDDDFCTIDEPCGVNEGDCDSNDECKNHLFCGSNNCPESLEVLFSILTCK